MENLFMYVIGPLIGALAGSLTTILSYRYTQQPKDKVEIKGDEIQNTGSEFENYMKYVQANNVIMNDMKHQIQELIESNAKMREANQMLQDKVTALTRSNNKLCKELSDFKESLCTECPRKKRINDPN